ncbi:hypothetical protein JTB14_009315 [Gonioctena quinquepunctata]|nr:hypothetical protein JTB14_009315 [Gonioctena quinquepunctata]
MAEYNNAAHSVEENLQRISIIDNQLNVTEDFAGGYVEDMIIDEEQLNVAMNVDSDDEGVELGIPNKVMVRGKTLPIAQMDGRACYTVSLVEVRVGCFGVRCLCIWCFKRYLMAYNNRQGAAHYDHVDIHKIHTPETPSFKCFGCNTFLGQLRAIETCLICND